MQRVLEAHPGAPSFAMETTAGGRGWLVSPGLDLLLCCGGAAWLFVFADQVVLRPHFPNLLGRVTVLMSVVGWLLGSSHSAATWVRIYDTAEARRRFALYTRWIPLGLVALGALEFGVHAVIPVVLKITLFWNLHHYTAQSYGFVMIYCLRAGYPLTRVEKAALRAMMTLSTVTIATIQLTYREYNLPTLLGQTMPFWGPLPTWVSTGSVGLLVASVVVFATLVVAKAARERRWLPLPAAALIVTNLVLMVAPVDLWNNLWAYTPALFHGSQYLVITLLYFAGDQAGETVWQRLAASGAMSRYILMVAVGAFFYSAVPQTLQQAGVDFNLSFAVIYSLISLHHYATDGAIWKLRDDRLRALLVG